MTPTPGAQAPRRRRRVLNAIKSPPRFRGRRRMCYPPAMIKLTFCLHRLPSLSRAEFQTYWREAHAPLVASVQSTLRIHRYVQTHASPEEMETELRRVRGGPPGYDGVAELWWMSAQDLAATSTDPAAIEAGRMLLEDERTFIDLSRSPLFWGEEKTIIGQAT